MVILFVTPISEKIKNFKTNFSILDDWKLRFHIKKSKKLRINIVIFNGSKRSDWKEHKNILFNLKTFSKIII
jgi:hypothetical protein